jgi:hypothetical protein
MNVLNAINLLQDIAKDNPNATLVIKADGVYIPIEIQHKKISCQLGVDDSFGKEFAVIDTEPLSFVSSDTKNLTQEDLQNLLDW